MLVIDRVKLLPFDQSDEVRELERGDAVGLEQCRKTGNEVVDRGNMGEKFNRLG